MTARPALTPTELACISRAAAGMQRGEIAAELDISKETVKGHLASVYRKTGTSGAREAGRAIGLLPPLDRPPPRRGMARHGALPDLPPARTPLTSSELTEPADRPAAVQEERDRFEPFPPSVQPPSHRESRHDLRRPYERAVLILALVTLLLVCLTYLPRLIDVAQLAGNSIDPPERYHRR